MKPPKPNGWQRIWICVAVAWSVTVFSIGYSLWPDHETPNHAQHLRLQPPPPYISFDPNDGERSPSSRANRSPLADPQVNAACAVRTG